MENIKSELSLLLFLCYHKNAVHVRIPMCCDGVNIKVVVL